MAKSLGVLTLDIVAKTGNFVSGMDKDQGIKYGAPADHFPRNGWNVSEHMLKVWTKDPCKSPPSK
jgi:hypothetical protein